jgi:hypothetical protein
MFFKQLSEGKNPIRHLVSNAALRDPGTADALDEEDIKTFMSIAQFIATLSRTQRENFASVANSICDTHLRQSISKKVSKKDEHDQPSSPKRQKPNTSPVVPVPRTKEELRSIFKEGKTSLFKNLPHPAVYTESNHSYILPSECVADLMAHGIIDVDSTADKLSPVESLACCPLARAITEENNHHGIKTIIVSRWSDDFEPNSGMKGGRGTIWITTLTIQTAKSGTPGISHVYPLAVGPTDSDHEPIERIILDDLKKLDCTRHNPRAPVEMFNGQTKQNEKVSVHFLAMTQDQPERRSSNGMLGGKSTYHARFGYSFKIKDFIDTLPACTECLKHMEQVRGDDEWVPRPCSECHNWMARGTADICFKPSPDFPQDELPPSGMVPCIKLTYDALVTAKQKAHESYKSGKWNKAGFHQYLTYHCLSKSTRNKILQCAHKCNQLYTAETNENEELLAKIRRNMARFPQHYQEFQSLNRWTGWLELRQNHEAHMHILFLGLVKYAVLDINDWASLRGKYTSLQKALFTVTNDIQRLHLSWCKVFVFKGEKLGGWVSENFMGFARILPWAYTTVLFVDEDPPYVAPDTELSKWTVQQCKDWLRSRGLPLAGRVKDLRDRIEANIDMEIGSTKVGSEDDVRDMVISLWVMLCQLMGMTTSNKDNVNVTSRLIRMYLNRVHKYDSEFIKANKRNEPMWLSAYNHMCLLNLPEQIELLGPIRNRWEGGFRGEGFIRKVKPMTTGVGRTNWTKNLLTNLLQQRALIQLRSVPDAPVGTEESADDDVDGMDDDELGYDLSSFVKYANRDELMSQFTGTRKVISCLIGLTEDDNFARMFCCYNDAGERRVLYVEFDGDAFYSFGAFYFQVRPEEDAMNDEKLSDVKYEAYGLLLPILHMPTEPAHGEDTEFKQWYTLVDSRWRAISEEKELVYPHTYVHREFAT